MFNRLGKKLFCCNKFINIFILLITELILFISVLLMIITKLVFGTMWFIWSFFSVFGNFFNLIIWISFFIVGGLMMCILLKVGSLKKIMKVKLIRFLILVLFCFGCNIIIGFITIAIFAFDWVI
jgi:hypothetical protein